MAIFNIRKVINEAYFGRTPGIQKIIDQIGVVRNKYGVFDDTGFSNITGYKYPIKIDPRINSDPEMIKLNNLFEEEFGFATCAITITPTDQLQGCTFPISLAIDVDSTNMKQHVKSTSSGFKFDRSLEYNAMIIVSSGVFLNNNLTNEEVTAIILHEVGHNFQAALSNKLCAMNFGRKFIFYAQTIWAYVLNIITGNFAGVALDVANSITFFSSNVRRFDTELNRELAKSQAGRGFLTTLDAVKGGLNTINGVISDLNYAKLILMIIGNIAFMPLSLLRIAVKGGFNFIEVILFGGYRGEQIADTFATMYGLGPELISGLDKIDYHTGTLIKQFVQDTPIIGHITDFIMLPYSVVCSMFDEHPTNAARGQNVIDSLRYDVDHTDMDARARKALKDELNRTEIQINNLYENRSADIKNPRFASRMWNAFLYKRLGGDFKHYVFKTEDNIKDINKTYEDTGTIGKGLAKVKFK